MKFYSRRPWWRELGRFRRLLPESNHECSCSDLGLMNGAGGAEHAVLHLLYARWANTAHCSWPSDAGEENGHKRGSFSSFAFLHLQGQAPCNFFSCCVAHAAPASDHRFCPQSCMRPCRNICVLKSRIGLLNPPPLSPSSQNTDPVQGWRALAVHGDTGVVFAGSGTRCCTTSGWCPARSPSRGWSARA